MKKLTAAHIVFSSFYLFFFLMLSGFAVAKLFVVGYSFSLFLAAVFCIALTVLYVIRLIRIRRKLMVEDASRQFHYEDRSAS